MNILYLDDTIPNGKHIGKLVADVVQEDPSYLKRNISHGKAGASFCFSDTVIKEASNQPLGNYIPRR